MEQWKAVFGWSRKGSVWVEQGKQCLGGAGEAVYEWGSERQCLGGACVCGALISCSETVLDVGHTWQTCSILSSSAMFGCCGRPRCRVGGICRACRVRAPLHVARHAIVLSGSAVASSCRPPSLALRCQCAHNTVAVECRRPPHRICGAVPAAL